SPMPPRSSSARPLRSISPNACTPRAEHPNDRTSGRLRPPALLSLPCQNPEQMADRPRLRLGTRGSPLARWQADHVAARLASLGIDVEMVHITTQGDVKSGPLGEIGGQGLFTKEIQRALLDGRIDLAVHSL